MVSKIKLSVTISIVRSVNIKSNIPPWQMTPIAGSNRISASPSHMRSSSCGVHILPALLISGIDIPSVGETVREKQVICFGVASMSKEVSGACLIRA